MACTIEELQATELEILCAFDDFCKKHSIEYGLSGGTLLGAVRHDGFIPWDDDVDVLMSITDFKKLMKRIKKEPMEGMHFQWFDVEEDKEYPLKHAKLRKNGTLMSEYNYRGLEMNNGVYIDIFTYVSKPKSDIGIKIQETVLGLFQISLEKDLNKLKMKKGKEVTLNPINKAILKTPDPVLKLFRKLLFSIICLYNNPKTENVRVFDYTYDTLECVKRSYLEPNTTHIFNGKNLPIPENYDSYLRLLYGDNYMTPVKTHNHIDLSVVEL